MNEIMENEHEETSLERFDTNAGSAESDKSDPDPTPHETDSVENASDPPSGELDSLRAEVSELRELLARKERERSDAMREIEDFHRLFPHVPMRQIPDTVWERRGRGIPLNAAYALYECELSAARAVADQVNQTNATRSAGRAGTDTAAEYFTAEEVRAMSQKQVRANYNKIRESMKKWN